MPLDTLRLALILLAFGATTASADITRGTLREVSLRVVDAFNAGDAAALAAMAAPAQRVAGADSLAERLADCRQRFGAMERVSLPTMGTLTYGLFAAYFPGTARDLFLEIDRDGRITVLTIVGRDGSCSLVGSAGRES